jgi:quinol monooxygenase YgiN
MPVVVSIVTPKPGKLDEVVHTITSEVPGIHTEPGCGLYALYRGDDKLVMIEKWDDVQSLQKHGEGTAMVELGVTVSALVEGIEMHTVEPIAAGDPAKGLI